MAENKKRAELEEERIKAEEEAKKKSKLGYRLRRFLGISKKK